MTQSPSPTEAHAVIVHESAVGPPAIVELMRYAIERGVPVDTLERLQVMHERAADRAAATEFAAALARFQATCPPIPKRSTANIATRSGVPYHYRYAELDQIARIVGPLLHGQGLSFTWDNRLADGTIHCVCTLRHVNGHQVTATFTCPTDSASAMSAQQKVGAALTFARRQALVQVLGLTTCDPDTDAANPEPITADQAADLDALIEEMGAGRTRVLKFAKVARVAEILARDYDRVVAAVRAYPEQRRQRAATREGAS